MPVRGTNISKGNIPSNLKANFPEDEKYNFIRNVGAYVPDYFVMTNISGFGCLEVACWLLVPKFAGSHPAEAVGFLGRKNPQHAPPPPPSEGK